MYFSSWEKEKIKDIIYLSFILKLLFILFIFIFARTISAVHQGWSFIECLL